MIFRPGSIQPMDGIVSKTGSRLMYALAGPLYPMWKRLFPGKSGKPCSTSRVAGGRDSDVINDAARAAAKPS